MAIVSIPWFSDSLASYKAAVVWCVRVPWMEECTTITIVSRDTEEDTLHHLSYLHAVETLRWAKGKHLRRYGKENWKQISDGRKKMILE